MAITSIATVGVALNVYFGTDSPPTITGAKTGEEYYKTSDGTITGTIEERWLYSGSSWFKTDQAAAAETVTSLSFAGSTLTYVDENGTNSIFDISTIDTSVVSASYDPATSIMTFTKSDGTTFTTDLATINEGVAAITLDMTGFPNRTDSELLYNEATSILTLQPKAPATQFTMYYRGEAIVVSSALDVTVTNTGGGRYIVYNKSTGQLEEFFPSYEGLIKGELLVSYVYLDGTNTTPVIFGDERHSSDRDTQWHLSKHLEEGAVWRDGGVLAYTLNDDANTALAFSTPITVADEDVVHTITHSATPTIGTYQQILESAADLPVLYYLGADFTQLAPTTAPFVGTGQVAKYNLISAGSGSLADAPNNAYINYWVIFTNDSRYPVKLMLGQAAHTNLNDAEAENFAGYDLPLPEIVVAYKVTTQHNTNNTNNDAGLVVTQVTMISGPSSSMTQFYTTNSHANLTGRNLPDQHSIASITGLQTTLDQKIESLDVSGLTDTDVTTLAPIDDSVLYYDAATSTWLPGHVPWVESVAGTAGAGDIIFTNRVPSSTSPLTNLDGGSLFVDIRYIGGGYYILVDAGDNRFITNDWTNFTDVSNIYLYSNGLYYTKFVALYNGTIIAVNQANAESGSTTGYDHYLLSTDGGSTWAQEGDGLGAGVWVGNYITSLGYIFGTSDASTAYTTNYSTDGVTWSQPGGSAPPGNASQPEQDVNSTGTNVILAAKYSSNSNSYLYNFSTASVGTSTQVVDVEYAGAGNEWLIVRYDPTTSKWFALKKLSDGSEQMHYSSDGLTWTAGAINTGKKYVGYSGRASIIGDSFFIFGGEPTVSVYSISNDTWTEVESASRYEMIITDGNGDTLIFDTSNNFAETTTIDLAGGTITYREYVVDDLLNVNAGGKTDGDVLVWDTTTSKWVSQALPSGVTTLAALDDTNTAGATDGQVLTWDNANSEWVPTTPTTVNAFGDELTLISSAGGSVTYNADYARVYHLDLTGTLGQLTFSPFTIDPGTSGTAGISATVVAVINQNGTAGSLPTQYAFINTSNVVTPKWAGGSAPTPGAVGSTDVITFTITCKSGDANTPANWTILGQHVNFA